MIIRVAFGLLGIVLACPSYAQTVRDVDAFGADELRKVNEQFSKRTVAISAQQKKLLLAELDRDASAEAGAASKLRTALESPDGTVNLMMLIDHLRSPVLLHDFRTHADPVLRFRVSLRLAGTGDTMAAESLPKLFGDASLPVFDARVIKTMLLALGINPDAKPAEITQHLQSLQASKLGLKSGDSIDDFEASDVAGNRFKLSDFRGTPVFIHFWATNCGPCMAQMPEVREKLASVNGKLEVIFVSLDYDKSAFDRVKAELDIPCRHVCDERSVGGNIARHFSIDRMPVDIVIDAEGRFVSYSLDSALKLLREDAGDERDDRCESPPAKGN